MSKYYSYNRVKSINSVDFTGETEYYLFEEGVGHKKYLFSELIYTTLKDIQSMVDDIILYTREEKPWHECIPEHGILCWVKNHGLRKIIKSYPDAQTHESGLYIEKYLCVECECVKYNVTECTPLTNEEIKQFLREEN